MSVNVAANGILPVLLRRKRLLLLSSFIAACIAFAGGKVLPLHYGSEGSLIIDQKQGSSSSESSSSNAVLTEVDYLQSKGLIRQAVIDNKLDEVPDLIPKFRLPDGIKNPLIAVRDEAFQLWQSINGGKAGKKASEVDKAADYIQAHLKVSAKEKSFVITLWFEAGSPQTAALITNSIIGTYLKGVEAAKLDRIKQADMLVGEQITKYRQEVSDAEKRVTDYLTVHNLPQVQASQTAVVRLSEDERQLLLAHEDLARKEAALHTINSNTVAGSSEALDNKTIQTVKELLTRTKAQYDVLGPTDPRRDALRTQMASLESQLSSEKGLIFKALSRDVEVARARVDALETSVKKEREVAQSTTIADTSLKQLMSDLDGKRQLLISFITKAGEARIGAIQAPTAHQLFPALPPERPAHSFGLLSIILGLILGFVGSAGTVVLRSMLNTKVNTAEEAAVATGLPVIGSLPRIKERKQPLYSAPPMAETFRTMWLTMRPQNGKGVPVLVTSSEIGEGKTTIAMALAQRFADDDFRVLLIDADLRHPRLSSMLGRGSVSLLSVLNGDQELHQAVTQPHPNLDCLLTVPNDNPARILGSQRFAKLLELAATKYDFVILDSPPTMHVADPIILGKLCQYIVFVVQSGRLSREAVSETIRRFPVDDRQKVVTLLNRVPRKQLDKHEYYSGYAVE